MEKSTPIVRHEAVHVMQAMQIGGKPYCEALMDSGQTPLMPSAEKTRREQLRQGGVVRVCGENKAWYPAGSGR